MNVAIPVAHFVSYNTARYLVPAFESLGHQARIITQAEYYEDQAGVDLFFCCDSGGALNFPEKHRARSTMWFIDSRRNSDPAIRTPDDDTQARVLTEGGGWVFQAQYNDWARLVEKGVYRSSWLPLAADPDVWKPVNLPKAWDVSFCGNIWDGTRADMLNQIRDRWTLEIVQGDPVYLASVYSAGRLGFNISSFYGTPWAYDVNMRVFEVMACGIPLVTNWVKDLALLGFQPGETHMEYLDQTGALQAIEWVLAWEQTKRDHMGALGRQIIKEGHTYTRRMANVLEILEENGIIE